MRSVIVTCLMAGLSLGLGSGGYAEAEIDTFTLDFSPESMAVTQARLLDTSYDILKIGDLELTRDAGKPALPVKAVQIYVPLGSEVTSIHVESTASRSLEGEYLIYPAQPEVPLASLAGADRVPPDAGVYSLCEAYPASPVMLASVGTMAGRRIAAIRVFPLQYVPAERRVILNESITFSLELKASSNEPRLPRETADVRDLRNRAVEGLVENPGDLIRDFPPEGGTLDPSAATEYLILCKDAHRDEYEVLKNWKTRKGIPAKIVTLEDAAAAYPGRDVQESYRNCIMDYYYNESTAWVLMTLSAPKADIRGCYGRVGETVDNEIPCDLYFSDMDGDWDLDGDLIWGETTDDADLYPDVYVGRLTANTGVACSTVVHKVLTYEGCYAVPTDYQLDMLFMAEYLDDYTDEAVLKNLIDSESVPSRFDPITKLYESTGNLDRATALAELNAGSNLINHAGHGNATVIDIGPDYLTKTDMENLTNAPRYSVFYTLACSPGAFDQVTGCLGKSFVEAAGGGGFFIGNSRVGFYTAGSPGQGTGDRYDREFFESVFVRDCVHLGVAHADAKVQRIPYSGSYGTNRWQQFTLNLLGDPETPIWVDTPIDLVAAYDDTINAEEQVYTVTVSAEGAPLSGARVCLWMGDALYEVDDTGGSGEATFMISPADSGTILVTAVKDGYLPHLGTCAVLVQNGVPETVVGGGPAIAACPNPAAGSAIIAYAVPGGPAADRECRISIYDAAGRFVAAMPAIGPAGTVTWDGKLADGASAPAGVYFARLHHPGQEISATFVLLR
jgi:hypothetical protein